MFKAMLSFSLLLAAAAPAAAADRRYTVTDFDRIQVQGPFEVVLSTNKSPAVSASGSAQAIERLDVDVQGRTLHIRPNRSSWGGYPGQQAGPVRVTVSTHGLRAVLVAGPGSVSVDKAKAMRFDVSVSGAGRVALADVEADQLIVGLLGSGRIDLGGKAKRLRATIQGTGDLAAKALATEDAEVNSETSGTVEFSARRTAKVTSTGQGDTIVAGEGACTVSVSGSGRVLCGK